MVTARMKTPAAVPTKQTKTGTVVDDFFATASDDDGVVDNPGN